MQRRWPARPDDAGATRAHSHFSFRSAELPFRSLSFVEQLPSLALEELYNSARVDSLDERVRSIALP